MTALLAGGASRPRAHVDTAPMNDIVEWWRTHPDEWGRDTDTPLLRAAWIGWGEPFCFACGWLAPVKDGRRDSWRVAGKWLDRAHLHDHVFGGSNDPSNFVLLCHLCHYDMPESADREGGLLWVYRRPMCHWTWQIFTDGMYLGVRPPSNNRNTLLRALNAYRGAVLDAIRQGVPPHVFDPPSGGSICATWKPTNRSEG